MLKGGADTKRLETWVQETFGRFKFVYCEFLTEKYVFVNFSSLHDMETQGNKLVNEMLLFEEGNCESR